jgi:hypothetical protein
MTLPKPTETQVTAALRYAEYLAHSLDHSHRSKDRTRPHTDYFRSDHGRPSQGAKDMGLTEYETLPHRATLILAAALQHRTP